MISTQDRVNNIVNQDKDSWKINEKIYEYDKALIRDLIDELDDEILKHLQMRQRLVDVLHEMKEELDKDMKDPAREDAIKNRLISEYPDMEETIKVLYNHIFDQDTI